MQISFILVEPAVHGNVGAAARAIKTMGFSDLRLVNPCNHLSQEARKFAHGSIDILEEAEVFNSLPLALENIDLAVATTSKKRSARLKYLPAENLAGFLDRKGNSVQSAGIVFGREESGLSNDEIRMCDMASSVPLAQAFPSLNLGQAVMIFAYSLSKYSLQPSSEENYPARDLQGFRVMMDRTRQILDTMGLQDNPTLYNRLLERLAQLGEDDIHLVHSFLNRHPFFKEE